MLIGTRVKVIQPIDVYPNALADVGETGTLVRIDQDGSYWVKLDKHHAGLNEWNNEIQIWDWSDNEHPEWKPQAYLEAI